MTSVNTGIKCKKCKLPFPFKRYELGYENCVKCSEELKWSAVPIINHKTGNEVQIVKDPEDAAEFFAKSARVGFGTMRGMSSTYKRHPNIKNKETIILSETPITDRVINRKSLPNEYDIVGEAVMHLVDIGDWVGARTEIQNALVEKRIWGIHSKQLNDMLDVLEQIKK